MKTEIAITDLTRMQEGRVCIAGYDREWRCIRPILPPPGIPEDSLRVGKRPIIYPFAVVEFDLLHADAHPPHIEDHRFDPDTIRFVKPLDEAHRRKILDRTTFPSVEAIFETPVYSGPGFYVMEGCGCRSLGTMRPTSIDHVIFSPDSGGRYRVTFTDSAGEQYRLAITDLTWWAYHEREVGRGRAPQKIAGGLYYALAGGDTYLRIGLARGWEQFPERCFLQITGLYTFPDYLRGATFASLIGQR